MGAAALAAAALLELLTQLLARLAIKFLLGTLAPPLIVSGCGGGLADLPPPAVAESPSQPTDLVSSTPAASPTALAHSGSVILVGRIATMAQPAIAEAIAFEDGRITAVGARGEVLALADNDTRVIELGDYVAYPGFVDAHSHWIGDREHYGGGSPQEHQP